MKKKTLFFSGIIVCLVVIAATAFYWYQKPRANLTNTKPAYILTANALYDAFRQDEKKANQQFLEKVIQVKGTVDNVQVSDTTVSLLLSGSEMGGINCNVRKQKGEDVAMPAKGTAVTVKGKCVGFLMDVNLVDVVIEK